MTIASTITTTSIEPDTTHEVTTSDGPRSKLLAAIIIPIGLLAIVLSILIIYIRKKEISLSECLSNCFNDQPKSEQRENQGNNVTGEYEAPYEEDDYDTPYKFSANHIYDEYQK